MTALRTQHVPGVPLAWVGHVLSEHQEVCDLVGRLSKAFTVTGTEGTMDSHCRG